MRLVSWNMNHWQQVRGGARPPSEAWEYLRSSLHADVALVQEAALPTEFQPAGSVGVFADKSRSWGTGIVDISGVGIDEVTTFSSPDRKGTMELRWTTPGAAAAAVIGGGGNGLLAISLYGQFVGGSSYAAMLHHAADLAPLLNDFTAVKRCLIAGDFNLNAQWVHDDAWFNKLEQGILDTFTLWDLRDLISESDLPSAVDCPCGRDSCRHVQTYWKAGSPTPWQNDHLLASPGLDVSKVWVDSAAVLEHQLSDHAPLVVEMRDH